MLEPAAHEKLSSGTCGSELDLHEQDHRQGIIMGQVTNVSSETGAGTWGRLVLGLFQHLWVVGLRTQAASMPLCRFCAVCQQGESAWEHWDILKAGNFSTVTAVTNGYCSRILPVIEHIKGQRNLNIQINQRTMYHAQKNNPCDIHCSWRIVWQSRKRRSHNISP